MRKKLLLLMLAAVVMLTACGGKSVAEGSGNRQETMEESEPAVKAAEKEEPEEAESPEPSEAAQAEMPETEGTDEQTEKTAEFSKGTVSESGWESEWLGMRFTPPEGTRMTSEEELNALMGISEELLSEDLSDAQIKYAELTSVREMMCYDEKTQTNVIIGVDRLPLRMSEEAFSEQLEQTLTNLSAMAYEKADDDETVEIAGTSYLKSRYRVEAMGQSIHTDYYIRIINNRAISLVLTYGDGSEELADAMLRGFTAY